MVLGGAGERGGAGAKGDGMYGILVEFHELHTFFVNPIEQQKGIL